MQNIILHPVGYVSNNRKDITDDNWGEVKSDIVLINNIPNESLLGLTYFSHIHVIFYLLTNSCRSLWLVQDVQADKRQLAEKKVS